MLAAATGALPAALLDLWAAGASMDAAPRDRPLQSLRALEATHPALAGRLTAALAPEPWTAAW